MTCDKIKEYYDSVDAVNYNVSFIESQLDTLSEINDNECSSSREEVMILTIICSALKYYCDSSPEGYGENILDIVVRLEQIYRIEGLLTVLLEYDTEE